jgi:hypothetical protein
VANWHAVFAVAAANFEVGERNTEDIVAAEPVEGCVQRGEAADIFQLFCA